MIKYALVCACSLEFEAWFPSMAGYEEQKRTGQISCPDCGSLEVKKAIMAPIVRTHSSDKGQDARKLDAFYSFLETHCDYVGKDFAQKAREYHDDAVKARPIYGQASLDEVKSLLDDGIEVLPIPEPKPRLHPELKDKTKRHTKAKLN